jgi:lactoylglutathione lyase
MYEMTFASVVIYVPSDAKRILDFYVDAFGLTLRQYDATFDFGELETGNTSIAVASHGAARFMVGKLYRESGDGFPQNVEIALFTDAVGPAFDRAVKAGCSALAAPRVMPWGQTVAYVRSIEGTLVGLLTPPAT